MNRISAILLCAAIAAGGAGLSHAADAGACLALLKEGNARFVEGFRQAHGDVREIRRELAAQGQRPIAAVLACADSREPVEYVFDQPLGSLFVVRTAGNTADVQTIGSLQYAVGHLHVPLVIVMGHTKCGAVRSVVEGHMGDGFLKRTLEPIDAVLKETDHDESDPDGTARRVEKANVRTAAKALLSADPDLAEKVKAGETLLLTAVYDIASGEVEWFEYE